MVELLIIAVCAGDYQCDQALKAYYAYRPEIQQTARKYTKKATKKIEQEVGEYVAFTVPALVMAASGKSYQIKITKTISFSLGRSSGNIIYGTEF